MTQRPLGVTLVAIIAWISGFLQTVISILVIIGAAFATPAAIIGWLSLIIGIITLSIGIGLWRGNRTARTIAIVVFVINIALEVLGMFSGESLWSALSGSALSIIALIMLNTRAARAYFGA